MSAPTHKLVKVVGIHPSEEFLTLTDEEAEKAFTQVTRDPDFVMAALFKAGRSAPLSGTPYRLVKARASNRNAS